MVMDKKVKNAVMIGVLCSVSYLAVYFARNILSAVTPQMVASGEFTEGYIGGVSSLYFIFYAIGQLINGVVGDKIKARYMISFGLGFAGVTNILFYYLIEMPNAAMIAYGMTGFFLSMIYGPMTKVVAENTEPIYATRCSLGYTFSSFFGSPLAGVTAALLTWQSVFFAGSMILFLMAIACFACFLILERKGIVTYNRYDRLPKQEGGAIRVLIRHRIIKFTLISIITGVIRTSVVFWLPTYISQHLGFSADASALLFTVTTFVISLTTFVAIFVYEKLRRNMDLTILVMFSAASVFFLLVFFLHQPALNLIFMVLAIMASNSSATMLWSRYCPSLRDTGMVSGATGFLDFVSYMSAAASSTIFANAVTQIGWGPLILIWFGLMVCGIAVALPWDKFRKRKELCGHENI